MAQEGFKTVVNLRTAGEQNQPLSPEAEGEVARKAGLDYLHIPVASTDPRPEQVEQFREKLSGLPGPVLVHCASGKRSGAFAILQLATQEGLSGEDALARARTLGFDWKSPELEASLGSTWISAGRAGSKGRPGPKVAGRRRVPAALAGCERSLPRTEPARPPSRTMLPPQDVPAERRRSKLGRRTQRWCRTWRVWVG
ncbi:beta-lactamase hydrolase domain-containing protein [Roseicella aerolata]|uniref:Protein tyrosine phosphatase family protein n=1 Tax=Roseicella aerolata TaxID=2883479 RepID=A0A9X1IHB5_9PROT|nr:protein tyrosine phosphatase family protein [Roseicella aerolata]